VATLTSLPGVLQIRDAKGGKDRQLPVSEPLRERLTGYHAKLAGQPGWKWFFPGATLDVPLTLQTSTATSGGFSGRRASRTAAVDTALVFMICATPWP